jgi:hypothetical protein
MSDNQIYYLKIGKNGKPESHPIVKENMMDIFDNFDPDNPPEGFVKFIKTPQPVLSHLEKYDYLDYAYSPKLSKKHGSPVWHEIHHIKKISKDDIINEFKKHQPECEDWIFDDETQTLIPPIPKPNDGKNYLWNIQFNKWTEADPDIDPKQLIEFAKELGYDLTVGQDASTLNDEIVSNIMEQLKSKNK